MRNKNRFTKESKELIKALHKEISLTNFNWHQLKSFPERRAAELISGALSQLINDGELNDIDELLIQAQKWIRKEVKDPGCSKH